LQWNPNADHWLSDSQSDSGIPLSFQADVVGQNSPYSDLRKAIERQPQTQQQLNYKQRRSAQKTVVNQPQIKFKKDFYQIR